MIHPKPNGKGSGAVFQPRRLQRLHLITFLKRCCLIIRVGCIILACIVDPQPVAAQVLKFDKDRFVENDTRLPWVLEADTVTYLRQPDRYVARGNVQISKADKRLTADFIQYDHAEQRAFARGNVVLSVGQDTLSGSHLQIDLAKQVGVIENAYLFLKESNFHITADKIEKTGENTYRIDRATLTTCDGPQPSWQIKARKAKIKADGAGTARHAILRARNVPVLYTPFFYYPARKDRQSGFLAPEFGDSERMGNQYNQPFFWAISENADATFYGHYMSKRGIKAGAEFRYILDESSRGTLMLDGFQDDKTDDGGQSSNDYGYEDAGEQVLRTNENRYWFRMSHHQPAPLGFFAKLDMDVASDQDYLREFQKGHMGYEDTNDHFLEAFSRQLDDYNDPVRTNRLNLHRLWPKFSLNFEPRWNDDTRRDINTGDTLQQLPFISFAGSKQKLMTSPLYFDLASQYHYFWRDSGTRGQRFDVRPRLYLPFRMKNYITIEPSAGYRQTVYRLDKNTFDDQPSTDRWSHRELFDTRLDLFTEVEKVYQLEGGLFDAIKHRIRPQITHEFIPHSKQSGLPRFDTDDRIDETNKITFALTNTLTSKSKTLEAQKLRPKRPPRNIGRRQTTAGYAYNDFFRLKVAQSYDFERSTRPFSPISAELDLLPGKYIWIDADARYSVYDNRFLGHNAQGTLWDDRGDELYVDYRYERASVETNVPEDIHSITGKLTLQITDSFSINGGHKHNFETGQRIETTAGFTYVSQCWRFEGSYTDEPNDWKVGFKIELFGLGEFGN